MKSIIKLNAEAVRFREKAGYSNREPIDIEAVVLRMKNYSIVRLEMSQNISGMCIIDEKSKLIAINSSMSIGRQRFTMAHELYHLEIENLREGKICSAALHDSKTDSEKEADLFASFLLMPYDGLEWYVENYNITKWYLRNIIELSQFYKMSYMATLFRLKQENRITANEFEVFKKQNIKTATQKYGYDVSLYNSSVEKDKWITLGEYPRMLEEKRNMIPESLFQQFCFDSFREDIINENVEKEVIIND